MVNPSDFVSRARTGDLRRNIRLDMDILHLSSSGRFRKTATAAKHGQAEENEKTLTCFQRAAPFGELNFDQNSNKFAGVKDRTNQASGIQMGIVDMLSYRWVRMGDPSTTVSNQMPRIFSREL